MRLANFMFYCLFILFGHLQRRMSSKGPPIKDISIFSGFSTPPSQHFFSTIPLQFWPISDLAPKHPKELFSSPWYTWSCTGCFKTKVSLCSSLSTTTLRQWCFRQCLPFSWTKLIGKHCLHPIAIMGVVD